VFSDKAKLKSSYRNGNEKKKKKYTPPSGNNTRRGFVPVDLAERHKIKAGGRPRDRTREKKEREKELTKCQRASNSIEGLDESDRPRFPSRSL